MQPQKVISHRDDARHLVVLSFLLATPLWSSDWPQLLGPARNGISPETNLAMSWPKEGPPVVWQKKVGEGFSGPVVAQSKLILFHRLGNVESVECLDARAGKALWKSDYPTGYQDDYSRGDGPRGTPAIADGKVFTFGAEGTLTCWNLTNGAKVWSVDTTKQFSARKGFFGVACSPLVEGSAVLLNIGGTDGAGIVAFDKSTGKVLWKATDDEASYSSPVAATVNGKRIVFFFTRAGLAAIDPGQGKVLLKFPWRARMPASVNAATPLVIGDLIFLSASYQTGAILQRLKPDNTLEKVWSGDEMLSNHYATSVYRDSFLYGIDGRHDFGNTELRCVEWQTGKVRWTQPGLTAANVTLAGNQLLVLTEKGELILAAATPEKFKETARAQILGSGVRASPALADGLFYARSQDKLVCVDLRAQK